MPSVRSAVRFSRQLAVSWLTVAPRVLYRLSLSLLLSPRSSERFLDDTKQSMDLSSEDTVLKSCDIREILPGDGDVVLRGPFHTSAVGGTWRLLELGCLAHFVRTARPAVVFEIGTFTGRTTRILALNAPEDASIFTLDLPQSRVSHVVGKDFAGTPEAKRIEVLSGDSTTFDFSRWQGKCDFVWIDANHEFNFVERDTETAMKLCRSGGWVGWHDYWHGTPWCGVTRAVRRVRGRFSEIRHIRGTTIALARMASAAPAAGP